MSDRELTLAKIRQEKLIAIVRGMKLSVMEELAAALLAGGISLIEVTFAQNQPDTWPDTAEAIRRLNEGFGGKILAGAGTVLTERQMHMAYDAGARYIITPNTNPEIISGTRKLELVSLPGAMTPTEIEAAWEAGADMVKVFPAGNLGPGYFKAVRAPLSHIPMLAVGGVDEKNIPDFLAAGACGFGVGGNLVNRGWIAEGAFDRITELAAKYVAAVR